MNTRRNPTKPAHASKAPRSRLMRYAVAGGTAVAVMTAGGLAWATWTNTATGTTAAGGGTLSLTVVSVGSTVTNKLFPGSAAGGSGATQGGDLVLNVTNPQNFPVNITSVIQNGPVTVDTTHNTAGCTSDTAGTPTTNLASFGTNGVWISNTKPSGTSPTTYTAVSGLSVQVAANATNVPVTIPNVVAMNSSSNNACQGATFTMPVTLGISM